MKILDDLLATLNFDAEVKDIRQGPFQTAVVTRYCGLASTPHDPGPHQEAAPVKSAGTLMEKNALDLAQMAYSPGLLEAAIGMATINSLLEVDEERCVTLNAGDLLAERGKGGEGSHHRAFSLCAPTPAGGSGALGDRKATAGGRPA